MRWNWSCFLTRGKCPYRTRMQQRYWIHFMVAFMSHIEWLSSLLRSSMKDERDQRCPRQRCPRQTDCVISNFRARGLQPFHNKFLRPQRLLTVSEDHFNLVIEFYTLNYICSHVFPGSKCPHGLNQTDGRKYSHGLACRFAHASKNFYCNSYNMPQ